MTSNGSASPADDLLARLPGSPDAYPQQIDLIRGAVLLILLDATAYRSASFLDDRILGPATQGVWVPVDRVVQAAQLARNLRPLHFIFHTGHVGSTLLSRLLDEKGDVLSVREPLPLRTLADASDALPRADSLLSPGQFERILQTFLRLWSRAYETTRTVVVKATSSVGRLAAPILSASERSRAVYLNVRAEPYLATLLAGENSPLDLRGHGPERMRRLQQHVTVPLPPLHQLSIGELAALSWLAESCTQRETLKRFGERVIALDFDAFLSSVTDGMQRVAIHFGMGDDARFLSTVGQSPALARYSKAPEHAYTPEVRAEVLRDSRRDNRGEIRKGMAWLEGQARANSALAELVTGGAL